MALRMRSTLLKRVTSIIQRVLKYLLKVLVLKHYLFLVKWVQNYPIWHILQSSIPSILDFFGLLNFFDKHLHKIMLGLVFNHGEEHWYQEKKAIVGAKALKFEYHS